MEARKITIVSTKTQSKYVIMSGAETLSELKDDLDNAGIDYEDMTFFEGTSKTELKTDDSVLPKDVPYTNRVTGEHINTNELVFMLTNPNKKIKSGATRADIYSTIKEKGLQKACIETYGKNFTQCSTNDLLTLLVRHSASSSIKDKEISCNLSDFNKGCIDIQAREAIKKLVNHLHDLGYLGNYSLRSIEGAMLKKIGRIDKPEIVPPYEDDEIDEMFRDMI